MNRITIPTLIVASCAMLMLFVDQTVPRPQLKVARRFMVSLRHRLPGGGLQSIEDCLQGP